MEKEVIFDFLLSEPQYDVYESRKRLTLDMAGQGGGKTALIAIDSGEMVTKAPLIRGFIGANTHNQLTTATLVGITKIWKLVFGWEEYDQKSAPNGNYVIDKKPPAHFKKVEKFKEYHNIISFANGAIIFVGSLENYKAHDGKEFGWAHLDETKDTKKEAITTVILGRMRQKGLYYDENNDVIQELDEQLAAVKKLTAYNPLKIHTSPAMGKVEWLNEMFDLPRHDGTIRQKIFKKDDYFKHEEVDTLVVIYSSWWNYANLANGFLESQLRILSKGESDKMIYAYPFAKSGGEFFPGFDRTIHTGKVEFLPGIPLHITYDFNVLPYMTLLCCQIIAVQRHYDEQKEIYLKEKTKNTIERTVYQFRIFKEFCAKTPFNTTPGVTGLFKNWYEDKAKKRGTDIFYYGDASGKSRQAGRGDATQFRDVKNVLYKYLNSASDRVPKSNPPILKRRDFIQRILEGRLPYELIIDEECKELIRDMEFLILGMDGKLKEMVEDKETGVKYQKLGHTSDALEYLICKCLESAFKNM